ncbi:hypothetical protein EMIT0P4_380009 [Pseudomonas sp. IT-P4]
MSTGRASSSLFYLCRLPLTEVRANLVAPILRNVVTGKNRYGQILSSDFSKLMCERSIDFTATRKLQINL